jgi:hypothetical protein
MKKLFEMMDDLRALARFIASRAGPLATLLAFATVAAHSPAAHADTMLLASTNLVTGSSAATFSFDAPGSGTVTAQISSLPWPVPLSALSFSATTATDTLSSWSTTGAMAAPQVEQFQVGAGTYFAHVMATAGGSLDLGLYSLLVTFTPSAVPLPAAGGMLLIGLLVLFTLRRTFNPTETRNESVMSAA